MSGEGGGVGGGWGENGEHELAGFIVPLVFDYEEKMKVGCSLASAFSRSG